MYDDIRANEQGAPVADASTTIVDSTTVMASIGVQREKWKLAAEEELTTNFQGEGGYRLSTPAERERHGPPIPMKCVWGLKRADGFARTPPHQFEQPEARAILHPPGCELLIDE